MGERWAPHEGAQRLRFPRPHIPMSHRPCMHRMARYRRSAPALHAARTCRKRTSVKPPMGMTAYAQFVVARLTSRRVERRTRRRRLEVEMVDRANTCVSHLRDAIVAEAAFAVHASMAVADRRLTSCHVFHRTCLFRTAKRHLRRFFHAIRRYHTAVAGWVASSPPSASNQAVRCDVGDARTRSLLSHHVAIADRIADVCAAWHVACEHMLRACIDPDSVDAASHQRACHELGEFIDAISRRHGAIADAMARAAS